MAELTDTVAAVRRFNRFFTSAIGALDRSFLGGPYTLAENRVLWEIAHADGISPKAICASLSLDPGYLSRMLARLERDGLVARARSSDDGRSIVLTLTELGRERFAELDSRQAAKVREMVQPLAGEAQAQLVGALATVQGLMGGVRPPPAVIRTHRPGDLGWMVMRHAELYGAEYGWSNMEGLAGHIVAEFAQRADPRERCWIAEQAGQRIGCVLLVKEDEAVARLRLLLLEPAARGLGLGRRLVDECLAFARAAGYGEVVLWTHQVLTAARAIYAAAGFQLEETWTHDEFGVPEVSETWRLKL